MSAVQGVSTFVVWSFGLEPVRHCLRLCTLFRSMMWTYMQGWNFRKISFHWAKPHIFYCYYLWVASNLHSLLKKLFSSLRLLFPSLSSLSLPFPSVPSYPLLSNPVPSFSLPFCSLPSSLFPFCFRGQTHQLTHLNHTFTFVSLN